MKKSKIIKAIKMKEELKSDTSPPPSDKSDEEEEEDSKVNILKMLSAKFI